MAARDKALTLLTTCLLHENTPSTSSAPAVPTSLGYTKFHVGLGNNYPLVRQLLKTRWWLSLSDKAEECQLLWTSWRKPRFTEALPKHAEWAKGKD